jgi:septum formation protein
MDNQQGRQAEITSRDIFGDDLLLASSSPRRSEILTAVGWPFTVFPVDIDERQREGEEPVAYVERLAFEKASTAAGQMSARLVLGADTVVLINSEILGKPRDLADAKRMLRMLSGQWHEVLTGVALVPSEAGAQPLISHERTRVRFAEMSDKEIEWHVENGFPLDKAGAYAVQGLAALFIDEIEGDYWNVVGLPVQLVYKLARKLSYSMSVSHDKRPG